MKWIKIGTKKSCQIDWNRWWCTKMLLFAGCSAAHARRVSIAEWCCCEEHKSSVDTISHTIFIWISLIMAKYKPHLTQRNWLNQIKPKTGSLTRKKYNLLIKNKKISVISRTQTTLAGFFAVSGSHESRNFLIKNHSACQRAGRLKQTAHFISRAEHFIMIISGYTKS